MKYEITLKQKQKLILTPQLYQSIQILQLNLAELNTLINQELIENPLLETNPLKNKESENFSKDNENIPIINHQSKNQEKIELGELLSYLREKEYSYYSIKTGSDTDDKYENILSYRESLQNHLLSQLGTSTINLLELRIGEYIIGNIDENGYLHISPEIISTDLNIHKDKVNKVLKLIQSFDPPGVGARNLKECLLIQEQILGYDNPNLRKIINDFLPELAKNSFKKIARELKISFKEIQTLSDIIKKNFDPKPGRQIACNGENKYIVPDLVLRKSENGEYVLLQNDSYLPRLKINYQYKKMLDQDIDSFYVRKNRFIKKKGSSGNHKREEIKKYIEEKIKSATLLVKGIEQRKKTIYRIALSLVDYQKDFLDKGILFLRPLKMKEMAEKLEIHESTVSRAIHNKYIQTPRGLIQMKYFFSKGIDNIGESNVSTEKVKKMIKKTIETENLLHPWNDQKIAELLYAKLGITIARRTVAKYRNALNILPYNLRKRYQP